MQGWSWDVEVKNELDKKLTKTVVVLRLETGECPVTRWRCIILRHKPDQNSLPKGWNELAGRFDDLWTCWDRWHLMKLCRLLGIISPKSFGCSFSSNHSISHGIAADLSQATKAAEKAALWLLGQPSAHLSARQAVRKCMGGGKTRTLQQVMPAASASQIGPESLHPWRAVTHTASPPPSTSAHQHCSGQLGCWATESSAHYGVITKITS